MLDTLLASDSTLEQHQAQHMVVDTPKTEVFDPSAMCVDTANPSNWSDEDEY